VVPEKTKNLAVRGTAGNLPALVGYLVNNFNGWTGVFVRALDVEINVVLEVPHRQLVAVKKDGYTLG